MGIKVREVLVFKDENHVDWKATGEELREHIMREYPEARPAELAMMWENQHKQLRALVKKYGVAELYGNIMH